MISENTKKPAVAIVDYGLGNLFSVQRACERVGLNASVTSDRAVIERAQAVVLPGVGAFGDAMATLIKLDLVSLLRDVVSSGKPFLGVCLGLQLLMRESQEFGTHRGLGVVEGTVVRFKDPVENGRALKVPEICWNKIYRAPTRDTWVDTPLREMKDGEYMYFVHSYYVKPTSESVVASKSAYGSVEYCSSIAIKNLFACQFHPERSGAEGLRVYRNWAETVNGSVDR